MTNTEIINKFYTAFQQKYATDMISCYHDEIEFTDPAFGKLKGERAKSMWKMLCENSKDLKIEFSDITENEQNGSVKWQAWYTFKKTGKKVHNIVNAHFKFKDGKIIEHIDYFNLRKWAGQALGITGYLLGWTFFFKKNMQTQTNYILDKFIANNKK